MDRRWLLVSALLFATVGHRSQAQQSHRFAGKTFTGTLGSGDYTVAVRIKFDQIAATAVLTSTTRRQGQVTERPPAVYPVAVKGDALAFTVAGGTEYVVSLGVFSPQLSTRGPGGQWNCALTEE
jgi:hypothetical protein